MSYYDDGKKKRVRSKEIQVFTHYFVRKFLKNEEIMYETDT